MRRAATCFSFERGDWKWRLQYNLEQWDFGVSFAWLGRGMQSAHLLCFSLLRFNRKLMQEQFDKECAK